MPASTAIGGGSSLLYDKTKEIIDYLLDEKDNDNEKN